MFAKILIGVQHNPEFLLPGLIRESVESPCSLAPFSILARGVKMIKVE
jgi:hypothetical protein